ncbi:MAG: hypothetical protein AVDCRST_MAG71-811 [uncultured Lysobacter sp.]|uniref:Uncharacterized protein n=1 Tax=uncultured Lysobacter sp. TaxID=271060 RepID=A0A6J4KR96_9GAMM|nr:MAG: hypothetical protein AVDCRST_MAG71-811 [uncultured Lysobacter sp.]
MSTSFAYLHTADGERLLEAEALVVVLSRGEIESGRVGHTIDRLMNLSDDPVLARKYEGRVHLVFAGYGSEPHQNATCRRFFRALTDQWPYWFHFLERREGSLRLALQLLVGVTEVHRRGTAPVAVVDVALFNTTVEGMLHGLAGIHHDLRIGADHTSRASSDVLRALRVRELV